MVDVKRPGINLETSEVFETSDLPEADQHYFQSDDTADSIEPIHVTINEAFGRFKGTFVDNNDVDFSDRIRHSRRQGYIVWKGEEGAATEENPVKKYQRLNCEVRELLDEITAAKNGKDGSVESATLESLADQADLLHKHLLHLRLEDVLGKEILQTMTDPQAAVRERLVSQVKEMKGIKSGDNSADKANTKKAEDLKYNLMLKPEAARLQAQSRLASLAARISSLEKIIGSSSEDLSILTMETGRKNLNDAVSVLSSKTTILEPKNLDHIEGRLAVLQQKLGEQEITEEEDKESQEKLTELAKVSERTGQMVQGIPDLVDRIEALSPLHSQAVDVSHSLIELETVQKQLLINLSNNSTLLKEIGKKFESNLSGIEKNFESLNVRINALKNMKK